MKPIFIHHYERELVHKQADFVEMFAIGGSVWEKMYMEDQVNVNDMKSVVNFMGSVAPSRKDTNTHLMRSRLL